MGISVGLSVALFCSTLIAGITAPDTRKVTKEEGSNNLVFENFQPFCTYNLTEIVEQPPESAAFGNIASGIIGVVAPGTVQSLVGAIDAEAIQKDPDLFLEENWQGFAFAFVAIPILFFLGVIFAFCVPCIGMLFCCCRCCDACGGKRMQKDDDNTLCKRATFALFLLATAIILGIGCASVYLGGKTSVSTVERSVNVIDNANSDLRCYTKSIFQELDFLLSLTGDAIQIGLDEVKDTANETRKVIGGVEEVFAGVKDLDESARALSESLTLITDLEGSEETLSTALDTWLDGYETTLNSQGCRDLNPCDNVSANFNRGDFTIPSTMIDISDQQNSLTSVLDKNLTGMADNLLKELKLLLDVFDADGASFDTSALNMSQLTDLTGGQVDQVDFLFDDVSDALNDPAFQKAYQDVTGSGFISVAIFAGLVGIIAVFYILGIIFGEIGRKRDDHPLDRDCMANCGGCLLVVGWVFSFIFYFIIAILAAFYFLGGSIGEIFICQPLAETSSFDAIKDLAIDLSPNSTGGLDPELARLKDFNIAKALTRCKANGGLYESLNLQDIIGDEFDKAVDDLTRQLNLTAMVDDINITSALNFDGRQELNNLTDLNFTGVNFGTLQTELDDAMVPNLAAEVMQIRDLAGNASANPTLAGQLNGHADALDEIIMGELAAFNTDLEELKAAVPTFQRNVDALKMGADGLSTEIQMLVDTTAAELEQQVNDIFPALQDYVDQTVNHIVDQIKTEVGKCRPLYNLYRGVDYIFCDNLINSLNAIWLGLGTAVVFFIIGIIFAVKLSKFYQRMLHDDNSHHGGYNGNTGQGGYPTYDKNNYPV